jgi:hypothetical protein
MKRTSGVAAILALFAVVLLVAPASAQPCTGQLVKFDADAYAYESSYANYISNAGSNLAMVGKASQLCPPMPAMDPSHEYTFYVFGLVSQGTTTTVLADRTVYRTSYSSSGSVQFQIYDDGTPDAVFTASPPNAEVPATFIDGTLIAEGTITNFRVSWTVYNNGTKSGVFNSSYAFTGGSLFQQLSDCANQQSPNTFGGSWNADLTSFPPLFPQGYSAHPNGKWDCPATPATPSTWGSIKTLYR